MGSRSREISVAVERMRAYIHAHLLEAITANDIARAAGYSQYHAGRLFKDELGITPFEYIRRERLLHSAHALRDRKPKVLDVALDYVFASHEGFTRAFSNAFGIAPKKFADHPLPEGWMIPYHYLNRSRSKTEDSAMTASTAVIFSQVVERPARKLILFRSRQADNYYAYCEEVGCGVNDESTPWDTLCEIEEALYEPVGLWLPENMRPYGTGVYAHGVEVPADFAGGIPDGFDVIDLEPCKLMVFQGEPYDDANFAEAVSQCMERIGAFNPETYGFEYADSIAPRMQLAPQGWRGYIEMRPIRSTV